MTSAIDATLPADGVPASKAALRLALATAKSEITDLQNKLTDTRNRIFNGAFVVDQRNNGSLVSIPASTAAKFTLDRWYGSTVAGGGAFSVQRLTTTPPPGFFYYAHLVVTTAKASLAAGDFHTFTQAIEGYHWGDMLYGTANAGSATLSFWVRATVAGTYAVALQNAGAAQSYVTTYTVNVPLTWEYKTVVIPGSTIGTWSANQTTAIAVRFDLGSGTTYSGATPNTWASVNKLSVTGAVPFVATLANVLDIGGVQLEPGVSATTFEYKLYLDELARVQRYYAVGQLNNAGSGTSGHSYAYHEKVSLGLRAVPTVTRVGESITNITSPTVTPSAYGFTLTGTFTATGAYAWNTGYAVECELTV